MASLESPPSTATRRRERRWTRVSLAVLAVALGLAAVAVVRLRKAGPAPAPPAVPGPLPGFVAAQALALLEPHLEDAQLLEMRQGPVRELRIKGRPRAALAQDFNAAFRPLVAERLIPLLRPHADVLSFEIANLDLPPVRLRPAR